MRKGWGGLVLVGLAVAAAGVAQSGPGHALLQSAGLFQVPPAYTVLAFTHPQALPAQLRTKHATVGVSFKISNASDAARTYHWSILVARSGRSRVSATGSSKVSARGSATVARNVPVSCAGGRLQVVARLAAPAESVDFWTACWSRAGGTR
jgi:hypothetical protein